jgi:hypothetical protein
MRYSCAIGTIGTFTLAREPISRAYMPPALTTISVSIGPRSVSTPVTRPRWTARPVTRVAVAISAPRRRAPSASASVSWLGRCSRRWQERSAEHSVRDHRWKELLRLVGRDELERQTERLRPARLPRDLLHPLGRRGEPERPDLVPARLEPHFGLERAVEVDALHHHPRERKRAAELTNQAGRVECRPARELGALDEHNVVPPEAREPVQDGAAADSASDHDCTGLISHGLTLNWDA